MQYYAICQPEILLRDDTKQTMTRHPSYSSSCCTEDYDYETCLNHDDKSSLKLKTLLTGIDSRSSHYYYLLICFCMYHSSCNKVVNTSTYKGWVGSGRSRNREDTRTINRIEGKLIWSKLVRISEED